MFPEVKMEEYIKPELSGILRVKIVAKIIVLGSTQTHFIHMRVKSSLKFVYSRKQSQCLYFIPHVSHFLSSCPNLHLIL